MTRSEKVKSISFIRTIPFLFGGEDDDAAAGRQIGRAVDELLGARLGDVEGRGEGRVDGAPPGAALDGRELEVQGVVGHVQDDVEVVVLAFEGAEGEGERPPGRGVPAVADR